MQPQHVLNIFDVFKAMANIINITWIQIFMFLVLFDIATGILKGFVNSGANSTKGLLGIIKHILVVVLVVTVYPYLTLLGANWVAMMFVVYFIATYAISVIENWSQIGLPMPEWVKQYFEKLQRESNEIDISNVKIIVDEPKKEDDI